MSSERQYSDIENKIIEAASGSDYPFDEASWKKMELLLDKRKDKHRPFFWIFTVMVLGVLILGGAYVYKNNSHKNNLPVANKQTDNTTNNQLSKNNLNTHSDLLPHEQTALPVKNSNGSNTDVTAVDSATATDLTADGDLSSGKIKVRASKNKNNAVLITGKKEPVFGKKNKRLKKQKEKKYTDGDDYSAGKKITYKTNNKVAMQVTAPALENEKDAEKNIADIDTYINGSDTDTKTPLVDTASDAVTIIPIADKLKPDTAGKKITTTKKTDPKKDKKKSVSAGLYVLGSLGAEINSTKLFSFKNSKIVPRYGFAAGYQINRRLSVQAGFYAGSKKYSAGPNDYTVKPGSYLSTVKIIEVDADCRVYEIPVTFQYNWLIKPATNYYVTVGLSGYLMKKEKYNYTFENYGTLYTYPYTYTKNSHLLASVNFSVGVEKKIGRKLYLQLAPVINVPLNGVGDGKVKLFTTSLNMGIKYFLFKK